MNDHSSTNTSKNQALVIALAVLLAVSLSAVAALVVNRANSQQIGADTPTTIQGREPARRTRTRSQLRAKKST